MAAAEDKRRLDAFWNERVLAHPPQGWSVRAKALVTATSNHIGVVTLAQRQVEDRRVFLVSGKVASRVLSDAYDRDFPPRPDERDSSAWHWYRDMHSLTDGEVGGPYLVLPAHMPEEDVASFGEAVRDVAADVVAPAVLRHMDDQALLADRYMDDLARAAKRLTLGHYRGYYEAAHLAAAVGRADVLAYVRDLFRDALRDPDPSLEVVEVLERDAQRLEALTVH
jgi:hypothetical protein